MAHKRRYCNFIVGREHCDPCETTDWRNAFTMYQKSSSATIYGLPTYEGANYEVIMSK